MITPTQNLLAVHRDPVIRKNGLKIKGKRFYTDVVKHLFTNRVIEDWYKLSATVIETKTIHSFKKRLQDYLQTVGSH